MSSAAAAADKRAGPPDLECLNLVSGRDILLFVMGKNFDHAETGGQGPIGRKPLMRLKILRSDLTVS